MFDFLFNEENFEYLYNIIGIVGVSIILFVGTFITKRTSSVKDDEFIKKLQEIHQNNIKKKKEKVVDKIKNSIDS